MQWQESERPESHRTELSMRTGVTRDPVVANGGVLLWREFGILHVSEVVFAFHLVLVDVAKVVLG